MTETEAYEMGRKAFEDGADRLSCPFPAPYMPPRNDADRGASAGSLGAFWLDGYEEAKKARTTDARAGQIMDLIPAEWDKTALVFVDELRKALDHLKDQGTSIDTGGGDGCADLWIKVGGVEFYLTVRKSNNQLASEGRELPPLLTA